ncbi:hypothetical protein SLEP1_g55717 [Rubroshorea leprosula]|uniref:Uncharacterized protein n=1 Tax=Rubroshorea leprosula TaxID=152421 RepID=A0AAV5MHE0_9ROSI|nr:hypothetical protein SLEP1_g55717 [Rubroshorea leprosula]
MPKDPSQKLSIGNWDEKTLSKKVRKAPYQNFASKIRSLCLASFRQELGSESRDVGNQGGVTR